MLGTLDFIAGSKLKFEFQLVLLLENDLPRPLPMGEFYLLILLVQLENLHYYN